MKNQKSNEKIFLSADDKRFYVYLHRDINGVVFYVGNGKTKGKKFYFSMYGEDEAKVVALKYIKEMKMLIQQELFYLRGEKCHL